jgi:3-deoxy-D-arabino-heptulosonate 7-phosphate (DAHP) synthase class II
MSNRNLTDEDIELLVIAIDERIDRRIAQTLKEAVAEALETHHICLFAEHERLWIKERALIRHELEEDRAFIRTLHVWLNDARTNLIKTVWVTLCGGVLLFLYLVFEHRLWGPK